jgi:hypothetical protein
VEPAFGDILRLAEAVRGRLPQDAVVISRKPTLFFAVSGYRSRMYPLSAQPDSFFRAAREVGAKFVVVDQIADLAPAYLYPVLQARSDDFCLAREVRLSAAALVVIDTAGPPPPPGISSSAIRGCSLAQYGGR